MRVFVVSLALVLVPSLLLSAATRTLASTGADDAGDSCAFTEGSEEMFPNIQPIEYAGPESRDPLSFRYYNAEEEICVKGQGCRPMKEWLRFSVSFWHTFRGDGSDPFGSPTKLWPWDQAEVSDELERARVRMNANFEFLNKLGVDYWCFHDRDIAPEGESLRETNENLFEIVDQAKRLNRKYGKKATLGYCTAVQAPQVHEWGSNVA
jgi:xylose isomerase